MRTSCGWSATTRRCGSSPSTKAKAWSTISSSAPSPGRPAATRPARLRFHDDDDKPVLDLGSDELARHRPRAFQEELAEDVRLLYVALTRARHRCDVALARLSKHLVSAASWLLQDAPPSDTLAAPPGDNLHGALKTHFKAIGAARWRANLEAVAERAQGRDRRSWRSRRRKRRAIGRRRERSGARRRRFKGEIERDFTISSFSSLTSETSADAPERFAPPWSEAEERASRRRRHPRFSRRRAHRRLPARDLRAARFHRSEQRRRDRSRAG